MFTRASNKLPCGIEGQKGDWSVIHKGCRHTVAVQRVSPLLLVSYPSATVVTSDKNRETTGFCVTECRNTLPKLARLTISRFHLMREQIFLGRKPCCKYSVTHLPSQSCPSRCRQTNSSLR